LGSYHAVKHKRGEILGTTAAASGALLMDVIEFRVCREGAGGWVVTLGNAVYGSYLDREQALLDAVDAARDAMQGGYEAQVWLRDSSVASRVF
jgi:hypothetical protein